MASGNVSTDGVVELHRPTKAQEFWAFVVLAVLIWPVIAIGLTGGFGFLIWMLQLVFGPPGAPR